MFPAKISKEEVNSMPVVAFDGEITVVDTMSRVEAAINELSLHAEVGIDTETKPSFVKGRTRRVALLQMAVDNRCFLFRLNKIGFPAPLEHLLADGRIKKVGLSLHDDMIRLRKLRAFTPENLIDIQNLVRRYGILELGLQKIFALVFGLKISKSQQLSNWESDRLSESQQRYAATDAWACLKIYRRLLCEIPLSEEEIKLLEQSHLPAGLQA